MRRLGQTIAQAAIIADELTSNPDKRITIAAYSEAAANRHRHQIMVELARRGKSALEVDRVTFNTNGQLQGANAKHVVDDPERPFLAGGFQKYLDMGEG